MKKDKPEEIVIIGGGEHAAVIADTLKLSPGKWKLIGFTDNNPKSSLLTERFNVPYLGSDEDFKSILKKHKKSKFILGIGGNTKRREQIVKKFALEDDKWAIIIHPSAIISNSAKIAHGTVILSRTVIQTGVTIDEHVIINNGAIIEHDISIGKFSHITPGVITGGGCKIGKYCFIGIGARIRDHVVIEDNVTVGTGSVVVADIPANDTVVGVPARKLVSNSAKVLRLEEICIRGKTTLYEALSIMDKVSTNILLITDDNKKLLGILAYGDLRNALLDHNELNQPVNKFMNTKYHYVGKNVSRVVALEQMKVFGISRMPILDDKHRVIGIHLLDTCIGSIKLDNTVIIMAGGKGERLRPLTEKLPKPMVKVAGRPILEHIIYHLAGSGISSIYISVSYLCDAIMDYFKDGSEFGCSIKYLKEEIPLGTAGSVSLLPEILQSPLIVINGDLITHFSIENILHKHSMEKNKITIGVHDYKINIPYGVINMKEDSVKEIIEKPEHHYLVNGGVYVIEPSVLASIPKNKHYLMTDLINDIIIKKQKTGIYLLEGDWIDVGHHTDLAVAQGK